MMITIQRIKGRPGDPYEVLFVDRHGRLIVALTEWYRLRSTLGPASTRDTYLSCLLPFFTFLSETSLLLKKLSQHTIEHGMGSESFAPIPHIPIVGAGCSFDLDMPLDLGLVMLPEDGSPVGEAPPLSLIDMPILVRNPVHPFVRMAAFAPSLKLLKEHVSTVMEGFFGDHTAIVIRPSMDHLVQFFDELSL